MLIRPSAASDTLLFPEAGFPFMTRPQAIRTPPLSEDVIPVLIPALI